MAVAPEELQTGETSDQSRNITAAEASEAMESAVRDLRRNWAQAALSVANIVNSGQIVGRGTFDDLRRLRENWEELERARSFLRGAPAQGNARQTQVRADQAEPVDDV